jgi:DNA-binding response OmpR family regulator
MSADRTVKIPLHIALVESDDLIRQLLEGWLTAEGHVTNTIPVRGLRRDAPLNLIIADVASASAAASRVALIRAHHAAPLLLISARFHRGTTRSSAMARQLGVEAVLPKPFTRDQLLAAVAMAVATAP